MSEDKIIYEIRRQGQLTRWTVFLCSLAIALFISVLILGIQSTVYFGSILFLISMMAALVLTLLKSALSSPKNLHSTSQDIKD